jgi:2-dehydro-3-deoxygluconokinase
VTPAPAPPAPAAPAAPRVVTFGELLLRLSPPGEERLLESPRLEAWFGGAEANVAVGLSHLGVRADYVTRLPDNPVGDAAVQALRAEGVGTDWILRGRGGERMGIYFVEPGADLRAMQVVYDRAGSAFARLDPDAFDWPAALDGARWLHVTGITPALGDGPAAALARAIACARAAGGNPRVSLDLNYREALWRGRDPRALIEPLAKQADVLIGNPAAVRAMLGVEADSDALATPERARRLADGLAERFGCRFVALTRREILDAREHGWSAVLYDTATGSLAQSRRHQVRVVDRVGGGDSFAAGLIAALLLGRAPPEALEFAVATGALKLLSPGDFSRVTTDDVERLLGTCT